ncbi:MAG: XdhC family protein [Verrucomicrobia bacterium]|nr:XdhC family protein [Verrucomicrobiota bacterium]
MKELQAIVRALLAPGAGASVLATLATVAGSSYRRPGARLLVTADGHRIGSISGGCLEEDVIARARQVAATGCAETVVYDTTTENDLVWGVGLGCHGIVRVVLEKLPPRPAWAAALAENFAARRPTPLAIVHRAADPAQLGTRLASAPALSLPNGLPAARDAAIEVFHHLVPPPTALFIFGAGDDAQPLARFAAELGWHVTIADPRAALATAERFPTAHALVVAPAAGLVARAAPDADTLAVVMTHHYVHDVPLLRELLARPLAYLGLLGPKKRAEKILADLAAAGAPLSPEQRARLHAPVGLDLGADSPAQVALAILAEMQAALTGRDARSLRDRTRPIHA